MGLLQSESKKQECLTPSLLWLFILDQDSCIHSNGGCTHQCMQGPFGATCICPSGYQLANDSKTCEDVNECDTLGFCSQQCVNMRGSFRCSCDAEYTLESDGRTCKVTGNHQAYRWTTGESLSQVNHLQEIWEYKHLSRLTNSQPD